MTINDTTPISCATCKHEDKDICAEPCLYCDPRRNSPDCKWEAKDVQMDL